MKKLILSLAFLGSILLGNNASASPYFVDEQAVNQQFENSLDITMMASETAFSTLFSTQQNLTSADKTVSGFLIRAFFCGGFALHRYYMGTGGTQFFWYYFCIPVVGGATACIDFFYVVFKGKEGMDKFTDNNKFWVWAD